jgi:lipoate-protein ligase A
MPRLGFLLQSAITPAASRHADRALLARATERGWGTLRVAAFGGDVLALGRWHLAPRGAPGVAVHRRLTGGRVAAAGAGFVQASLTLPHAAALVSDDPWALAPEQILNRAVRGVLGGLDLAGVPALYPGRDLVTVARRPIAVLGLEVDPAGATLVDVVLAVARDQSQVPVLLDRADPTGVVTAPMTMPEDVTSLGRELNRVPSFDEVATWLRDGFTSRFGVELIDEEEPPIPADDDEGFVRDRAPGPDLARCARSPTMLGVLEVHCTLAGDGSLGAVRMAGDLLAPSGTIHRLEAALRGCPVDLTAVQTVVDGVVRSPRDFVLGVGPSHTIAETVVRAAA